MSDFIISDMIDAANRASPSEFQNAFKDLVLDKIGLAIDAKRAEVAQNYFSPDEGEETEINNDNEEDTDEDTETDSGNEEEREA